MTVAIPMYDAHNVQQTYAAELWKVSLDKPILFHRFSGGYNETERTSAFVLTPDGSWFFAARKTDMWPGLAFIAEDGLARLFYEVY